MTGTRGYDPYGVVEGSEGSFAATIGFQSDWTDPTTKEVNMGARMYMLQAATFSSRDTYAGQLATPVSLNRYTYAHNNPLTNLDPSGNLVVPRLDGSPQQYMRDVAANINENRFFTYLDMRQKARKNGASQEEFDRFWAAYNATVLEPQYRNYMDRLSLLWEAAHPVTDAEYSPAATTLLNRSMKRQWGDFLGGKRFRTRGFLDPRCIEGRVHCRWQTGSGNFAREYTAESIVIRKLSDARLSLKDRLAGNQVADSVDWEVYVPNPSCAPDAPKGNGCRIDVVVDGRSIIEIKEWKLGVEDAVERQLGRYEKAADWERSTELNDEEWVDFFADQECGFLSCTTTIYAVWAPPGLDGHVYYASVDRAPRKVRERALHMASGGFLGLEGRKSFASAESKGYGTCPTGMCFATPPPGFIFLPEGAPVMA